MTFKRMDRRALLGGLATTLFTPALLRAQTAPVTGAELATEADGVPPQGVRNNVSGFFQQDWRSHFDSLGVGAIVCDMQSRALHYWSADGLDYRVYPTSVPRSEDLTKRGYTQIVRKKEGPSWTPTASQMQRFPDWKPIPAGPENPLGTHAMYLDWPAYLIHGTHDTRKIGRKSSDGCIGLFNEKISELFAIVPIGTQVRLI